MPLPQQPVSREALLEALRRREEDKTLRDHVQARSSGSLAAGTALGGASSLGTFVAYETLPWVSSKEVRGNDVTHALAKENLARYLQQYIPDLDRAGAEQFSELAWNSARRTAGGGGPEALARQQLFLAAGNEAAASAVDFSPRPAHGDLDRMAQVIKEKVKNPANESAVFLDLLGKQISGAARRGWLWGAGGAVAGGAAVLAKRKALANAIRDARFAQAQDDGSQVKQAADDNAGQAASPFTMEARTNPDVDASSTTPLFDIMASMISSTGRRTAKAIPVLRPPPGYAYDPQAGRMFANMQDPGWVNDQQLMAFRAQEAARLQEDPAQAQARAQAQAQAQLEAQGGAPGPQTPPEISGSLPPTA